MLFNRSSEFEKLTSRELEMATQRRDTVAALATAEAATATALIAGGALSELGEVERLKTTIVAIDRAVAILRTSRLDMIRNTFRNRAADLRAEAAGKQKELDSLQAKTAKYLAALSELHGVNFDETILAAQRATHDPLSPFVRPRSVQLETEIRELLLQATSLEQSTIPKTGTVDMEDITDPTPLLQSVLAHESDAPSAAVVLEWLTGVLGEVRRRGGNPESLPMRVHLTWKDSEINHKDSFIYVKALAKQQTLEGARFGIRPSGVDTRSATFRTAV